MRPEKRSFTRGSAKGRLRAAGVITVLACAVVVGLLAFGGVGARAATASVGIQASAFSPTPITINVGDTVTWTNTDSVVHTSTSNTGLWDSGILSAGSSFNHTFTQAGTFDYLCTIHGFTGRVVVVTASTTTSATSSTTTTAPSTTTTGGTTTTTVSTSTTTTAAPTTTTTLQEEEPSFTG